MGMGDCTSSVTPKFGILAPADAPGHIVSRYFMPWNTHPTMAVTGSQCLASCALTPGTDCRGDDATPHGHAVYDLAASSDGDHAGGDRL